MRPKGSSFGPRSRAAVRELQRDGIIVRKQGAGCFVTESASGLKEKNNIDPTWVLLNARSVALGQGASDTR